MDDATEVLQSVAQEVAPGVVSAIDVNTVVQRVDFQAVSEQVDIQSVVERVDLNSVLERVDVDVLIDRIDVDRVLERLDLNALLARVDIEALLARTEIGSILAATGSGVAAKVVDVARSQGVGLDLFVQRWVDRLLRRKQDRSPPAPSCPDPSGGGGTGALLESAGVSESKSPGVEGGPREFGKASAAKGQIARDGRVPQ